MNQKHIILFVDDEINILKSLKRVFEDDEYEILTAEDPHEGLNILKEKPVSLIISDYRMPDMDGVEFLEQAALISKDSIRVMLTGFADIDAIISAINKGQVFRYIAKPWNENELKQIVRDCLRHFEIIKDNLYLSELTGKQNEEFKELNKNLQLKIDERTKEILEKNQILERLYNELDASFFETIRMILKFVEMINPKLANHSKKVAAYSVLIGSGMGLSRDNLKNIEIAGLLHDIGKLNFPSDILFKKDSMLTAEQKLSLKRHPSIAEAPLHTIARLKSAAEIVLNHHENVDGSGYPNGKKGDSISTEAKILAVANYFENLTSTNIFGHIPLSPLDAVKEIGLKAGVMFDKKVTDHLQTVIVKDNKST